VKLESYLSQAAVLVETHAIDEGGLRHVNPDARATGVCNFAIIERPADGDLDGTRILEGGGCALGALGFKGGGCFRCTRFSKGGCTFYLQAHK
jgi:hypothetical protein